MSSKCECLVNQVTVIGVGLIGGSFALGIKQAGLVKKVIGFGSNASNLALAKSLGVVDDFSLDIGEAVKNADLVFLAVPLGAMESVLSQIKPFLKPGAIITDGGSSKVSVINAARNVFGELPENFVPGHPIAGKEKSGVAAADGRLYQKHRVILTPTKETSSEALAKVKQLWEGIGAIVSDMSPERHDEVLAATSHLPHILAFGLVEMLNEHPELGNVFQYTAGGFRDFTRIASSDATMWRDIAINNQEAILKWLQNYQAALSHLAGLIQQQDGDALYQLFSSAKSARDANIVNKSH